MKVVLKSRADGAGVAIFAVLEQVGKQIVLIDGALLTDLMLRSGVGVRCVQTFGTYEIDTDFFGNA